MTKDKRILSKAAAVIPALYLFAVTVSLTIMFMTKDDTAMSGIFLVMVTMPWPLLLSWFQETFHFDSMILTASFLVAGGVLNSVVLYNLVLFVTGRSRN